MPFAVILGESEQAAGQVKVKEMGLPDGHPEKDGVLVDISDLVAEIKKRLEGSGTVDVHSVTSGIDNATISDAANP